MTVITLLAVQSAGALGIRLDSGSWDTLFSGDSNTTSNVNFNMDFDMEFQGISGNFISIASAGQITLFDNTSTNSAQFNPFFDTDQIGGGRSTQFSLEATNAAFSVAGVDAGLRVTWSALDASGSLLNQYQVAFFALTSGLFAVEFNYDLLTFGDSDTGIGYSTSLGSSLDLLSEIGVSIGDALGAGDFDPVFPDLCIDTPDALACNNFHEGDFGPSELVLPGTAGGFFRSRSGSDSTPVQGRYLFLDGNMPVDVAEPSSLALLGFGALAAGLVRRRRIAH